MTTLPSASAPTRAFPSQALVHLDLLWIQVAGTLCNLECSHCFVSAAPGNDRHGMMSRDRVRRTVADGVARGVREIYFTGGEPFLHPQMLEILEDTLAHVPCTVLTNGTLFTRPRLEALRRLSEMSRYSLEIRVSLDGDVPDVHDAVRGAGTFARTLAGLVALERQGLLPIVTVTQADGEPPHATAARYAALLRRNGIERPRLKLLPLLRLGREVARSGGYDASETLAGLPASALDARTLQCASCRAVSDRGVFACPLLVDEPGGRIAGRLADALGPVELRHGVCYACHVTGMTCANG